MRRHAAAIVAMLLIGAPQLHAQSVMFKVGADAANVYKSPSTGSPVIGKAPHGAMLTVTRELGSWVKISWPQAPDGVGYVHVSAGSIAHAANGAATEPPAKPAAAPASSIPPPPPPPARRVVRSEVAAAPASAARVRRPSHQLGVGGVIAGPDLAVGVAARAWSRTRFGLQVDFARASLGDQPLRATSTELTPSAIYGFRDRVQDYWWLRPYVGAGPTFERRGFDGVPPGDPLAQTALGFQAFGGGEVTFASLPQFAVSLDLGYRWSEALAGIDRSGVRVGVSGHWYLR